MHASVTADTVSNINKTATTDYVTTTIITKMI